jgi:hypothetical protein
MSGPDVDELFSRMSGTHADPDEAPPEARRARVVSRMRQLHVELVHEAPRGRKGRRSAAVLLVAAAVVAAGTAFAAVAGIGPLGRVLEARRAREAVPPPVPRPNLAPHAAGTETRPPAPATILPAPVASAAPQQPSTPGEPSAHPPYSAARDTVREKEGQLEAVNRLFTDAKRARREGRPEEALAAVQQLLARYPGSVLAQEAAVERFRTLSKLGRASEASRYASSYLAHYPSGFAADEARKLAGSAP